ncbi:MAG: hypothetical protein AB7G48_10585 [Nitrospiraceae bacterium]
MKSFYVICLLVLVGWTTPVLAQSGANASNMEIVKEKLMADKKLLVATNMDLTDAEAKAFWPLYDDYQSELDKINNRLGRTIGDYAEAFNKGALQNDTAKRLMNEVLAVEESETHLKRATADKLRKVLPASKAARYIQMETKIRAIIKADLAQQIPLVY